MRILCLLSLFLLVAPMLAVGNEEKDEQYKLDACSAHPSAYHAAYETQLQSLDCYKNHLDEVTPQILALMQVTGNAQRVCREMKANPGLRYESHFAHYVELTVNDQIAQMECEKDCLAGLKRNPMCPTQFNCGEFKKTFPKMIGQAYHQMSLDIARGWSKGPNGLPDISSNSSFGRDYVSEWVNDKNLSLDQPLAPEELSHALPFLGSGLGKGKITAEEQDLLEGEVEAAIAETLAETEKPQHKRYRLIKDPVTKQVIKIENDWLSRGLSTHSRRTQVRSDASDWMGAYTNSINAKLRERQTLAQDDYRKTVSGLPIVLYMDIDYPGDEAFGGKETTAGVAYKKKLIEAYDKMIANAVKVVERAKKVREPTRPLMDVLGDYDFKNVSKVFWPLSENLTKACLEQYVPDYCRSANQWRKVLNDDEIVPDLLMALGPAAVGTVGGCVGGSAIPVVGTGAGCAVGGMAGMVAGQTLVAAKHASRAAMSVAAIGSSSERFVPTVDTAVLKSDQEALERDAVAFGMIAATPLFGVVLNPVLSDAGKVIGWVFVKAGGPKAVEAAMPLIREAYANSMKFLARREAGGANVLQARAQTKKMYEELLRKAEAEAAGGSPDALAAGKVVRPAKPVPSAKQAVVQPRKLATATESPRSPVSVVEAPKEVGPVPVAEIPVSVPGELRELLTSDEALRTALLKNPDLLRTLSAKSAVNSFEPSEFQALLAQQLKAEPETSALLGRALAFYEDMTPAQQAAFVKDFQKGVLSCGTK